MNITRKQEEQVKKMVGDYGFEVAKKAWAESKDVMFKIILGAFELTAREMAKKEKANWQICLATLFEHLEHLDRLSNEGELDYFLIASDIPSGGIKTFPNWASLIHHLNKKIKPL